MSSNWFTYMRENIQENLILVQILTKNFPGILKFELIFNNGLQNIRGDVWHTNLLGSVKSNKYKL